MWVIITLMFPSILSLAICLRSSSSGDIFGPYISNASVACDRLSNSCLHLLSNNSRKTQQVSFSVFPVSFCLIEHNCLQTCLHNWAYIDEYFGSSRALSKMRMMTPFRILRESSCKSNKSLLNFLNFSGVSLLRIPRTYKNKSC